MAVDKSSLYPTRWGGSSSEYPTGRFKNLTSPTAKDGSYSEESWENDMLAFADGVLQAGGISTAELNGTVDTAQNSQRLDALINIRWYQYADYKAGTEVTGSNGKKYACVLDHTKDTPQDPVGGGSNWEPVDGGFRVGDIKPTGGDIVPDGWKVMNGQTFDEVAHARLYAFLGNSNILPNAEDRYLRGATALDPALSTEEDAIKTHDVDVVNNSISIGNKTSDSQTFHLKTFVGGDATETDIGPDDTAVRVGSGSSDYDYRIQGLDAVAYPAAVGRTSETTQSYTTDIGSITPTNTASYTGETETRGKGLRVNFLIFAGWAVE